MISKTIICLPSQFDNEFTKWSKEEHNCDYLEIINIYHDGNHHYMIFKKKWYPTP